jgi:putative heme-binding domain-containing protein
LTGDPEHGRRIFQDACSDCHKIGDHGHEVGPDLMSVTARYKEVLLADILIPNQAVETGYEEYLVETVDGQSLSGIIANQTPTTLTIRRAKGEEDTVLRKNVKSMYSLSVSPMPEDVEQNVDVQGMADLIAYVKSLGT